MKTTIHLRSRDKRQASVHLLLPITGTYGVNRSPVSPNIMSALSPDVLADESARRSFFFDTNVQVDAGNRGPTFETIEDITPQESDYIYPLFRALSAVIIEGYWVEFPADVLKASVPLLQGQTVYKNHDFSDVEKWLGAVNQSLWDEAGAFTAGVPGINAELKIDWKVNPLIARGLLMQPPAIHSVSVTVLFTYDYSHPELEKEGKFWSLLGEKVDGQIVRLIANNIEAYWEISLVFQGADKLAKSSGGGRSDTGDEELAPAAARSHTAPPPGAPAPQPATATTQENPTVKLTAQQKKYLGLESVAGDDVAEEAVLRALDGLSALAAAGEQLLNAARAECLRVATLAEAGADAPLPEPIAAMIAKAGAGELPALTQMYGERAVLRFKPTCQDCGSTNVSGRSSVESPPDETLSHTAPATRAGGSLFN